MEPEFVFALSAAEYNLLRTSVGWRALSERQTENVFKNSAYLVALRQNGQIIGMTRVLTDFANIYFLADVIVLPEYQGAGLGRRLLTKAMDYILSCAAKGETFQVNLMAENGKEAFYEKFGFARRPNDTGGCGMTLWHTK